MNIAEVTKRFQSKKKILDKIQKVLAIIIVGVLFWVIIATEVWGAIIWAVIWLFVGYPITTWVTSALMLPFYIWIGGWKVYQSEKDARKMLNLEMTPKEFFDKWG